MIDIEIQYRPDAIIMVRGADAESVDGEVRAAVEAIKNANPPSFDAVAKSKGGMAAYRCHKVVHAAKIIGVGEEGVAKIRVIDSAGEKSVISVNKGWLSRYKGDENDMGYIVQYEDGYLSWSPSQAFEQGYTRI